MLRNIKKYLNFSSLYLTLELPSDSWRRFSLNAHILEPESFANAAVDLVTVDIVAIDVRFHYKD